MLSRAEAAATQPAAALLQRLKLPSPYTGLCAIAVFAREVNRTPGYPFFLLAMPSIESALIAQATVAGVLIFVIGVFVSRRWGSSAAS